MSRARCEVCGREGEFRAARVPSAEAVPPGGIAHCHRCRRFMCLRHAERLTDEPYLTCPFDPGVWLGPTATEGAPRD